MMIHSFLITSDEIIDEDDYYTSEDALENLTDQGRATLERLEGMLAGQSDVPVVGRTANGDNAGKRCMICQSLSNEAL